MRQRSYQVGGCACCRFPKDQGAAPYAVNVCETAKKNGAFRAAVWTGCHLQMTMMCIPPGGEIGAEVHPDTDQYIRVEDGQGMALMGCCAERIEMRQCLCAGCAVFVPAGIFHNIVNTGASPLKLSSVYAPPHHPHGTVHETRCDAAHAET